MCFVSRIPDAHLHAAQFRPTVILAGANTGVHIKGGEAAYSQYVRHLEKTSPAVMAMQTSGTVENFAQGYQDYLQAPLQVRLVLSIWERRLRMSLADVASHG